MRTNQMSLTRRNVGGRGGGLGARYLQRGANPLPMVVRDAQPLTIANADIDDHIYWYGLPPLFGDCFDGDITHLFYEDSEPFLNWLGMRPARARYLRQVFINYVLPKGAENGVPNTGLPTSLCEPGQGFSWGTCDFVLNGFGVVQRSGETWIIGGTQTPYCETTPRYRVDGTEITDPLDWELSNLMAITMNDLAIRVLTGNKSTDLDADGLLALIKTGYTNSNSELCPLMDSFILDWEGNPACGATEVTTVPTINGADYNGLVNLFKVLRDIVRRIRRRGVLAKLPPLQAGDMILALPDWAIDCVITCAVCWLECDGDYTRMDSNNAIARREEFSMGGLGFGHLMLDGFMLPLVPFNPIDYNGDVGDEPKGYLDNDDGTFDALLLTRAFGNREVLTMEYNDLSDGEGRGYQYYTNDNGQFLIWTNVDNRCMHINMSTEWRLFMSAPWAQVSILNVSCSTGVFNRDQMPFPEFVEA